MKEFWKRLFVLYLALCVGALFSADVVLPLWAQTPTNVQPPKISQLPATPTGLTGTELFPCDQAAGGVFATYKCTISQIPTYLTSIGFSSGGGGGGTLTSFNGRTTPAAVLQLSDITALIGTIGTAAAQAIGTSGGVLCLLNANCTFSGHVTFTGRLTLPRFTKTGSYTVNASESDYELCGDTTSAVVNFTTPASPGNGDRYLFVDCNGHAATNNITITASGSTIGPTHAGSFIMNINGQSLGVTFDSTNTNWDLH